MAGERILVVDDGREMRDFVVDYILKPNQFEPLVAENGLVGLEMMREYQPDMILLDLQMPKMNGMEVLDAMREEGIDIPVILMTFHGSEEIAIEVYRKGVRDYVKKPYTVDEMLAAIERNLAEVRLRKQKEELTQRVIAANAELNQRIRELNTLYQIGKSVTSLMSIDDLLPRVVRAALDVTAADEGSIYLIENNQIICRARKQVDDAQVHTPNQPVQDPFIARAIQQAQPIALNPAEMQEYHQKNPEMPLAVLYVPLVVADRVVGVLGATNKRARPFRRQDNAMLTALSDYAAIAIENASNLTRLMHSQNMDLASMQRILERFVESETAERLLRDPQQFRLQSAYVESAVFFVSLRGYNVLFERLGSGQLVDLMNRIMEASVNVVNKQGGGVDRFLGDGLVAFFTASDIAPNPVYNAAVAAIQLQSILKRLGREFGTEELQFSIGIHFGTALVGNVGVLRGLNLSVLGESVELARRLQALAQPGQILITEEVLGQLGDSAEGNYLGEIKIHGYAAPLKVYALTGVS